MKTWLLFLALVLPIGAHAEVQLGPSISFLSIPQPLSLGLNLKSNNSMWYASFGAFRTLYNNEYPIRLSHQSVGYNYDFQYLFLGLQTGHQKSKVIDGSGLVESFYVMPKIGKEWIVNKVFLQTEVGLMFHKHIREEGSIMEIKSMERFSKGSTLSFTILRIGYYF